MLPGLLVRIAGHVLQTLIALPIRERTALIDATIDLAQVPGRVIRID